jgi:non-specific serine/threonine protein kinase/serine/threonine-protein kinase
VPEDQAPPISQLGTLEQPAALVASSFGRYRLLQRLGEGGMGEIWLAEQTDPVHRQVALKVIKAGMDSAQVIARFEAERQALALMDHPAIATVFDGGTTPLGRPYFAMEYVKGEPITAYCDRHRLSTPERLELFIQVCEGVQHAHQKGIIHRDLKPSNVLVTIQDDHPVPKIIDFGVAKAMTQHLTERSLFTELGVLIGTPEYMSPEQAEMGSLDIDTRTDIYALGVLLYELLTGALPFDREDLRKAGLSEVQRIIREKEPARPSTRITQPGPDSTEAAKNRHTEPKKLVGELRGDLDWITMRALEKDRTRRYQTANALALDIRGHLNNEPVAAGPPGAAYRAGKFVRRHRFGVAATTTIVLLLAAFAAAMAVQVRRTARERDRAERLTAFMVDLFKVSDPSEARGNTITAREILDTGAERITRELKEEPETQAALMANMGAVYQNLGLLPKARPLLEQALDIRRRVLGRDHPDLLTSLNDLGWVLNRTGDYPKAEALFSEAAEVERRRSGGKSIALANSLNGLGAVAFQRGDYGVARGFFGQALELRKELLGDDHPDVDGSLGNLGTLLMAQGDYAAAEPVLRESLDRRRRRYGKDHPRVLSGLTNLAGALAEKGDLVEAESLYREALELSRRLFANDTPNVAMPLYNLGWVLAREKDYAAAEPLLREALAIRTKVLGPDHPDTAILLGAVGELLLETGRPGEAERLLLGALAIQRTALAPDSEDLAITQVAVGRCLAALRRFDEAEPLLLKSYGFLSAKYTGTRYARESKDALVSLYDAWGKPKKANEWRAKLAAQPKPGENGSTK